MSSTSSTRGRAQRAPVITRAGNQAQQCPVAGIWGSQSGGLGSNEEGARTGNASILLLPEPMRAEEMARRERERKMLPLPHFINTKRLFVSILDSATVARNCLQRDRRCRESRINQ